MSSIRAVGGLIGRARRLASDGCSHRRRSRSRPAPWCEASATVRAVDGIDLDVARGTIFAILGPNGAGKTTLMRMLATLLRPDAGAARR